MKIYSAYRISNRWLSDSDLFFYRTLTTWEGWPIVDTFAAIDAYGASIFVSFYIVINNIFARFIPQLVIKLLVVISCCSVQYWIIVLYFVSLIKWSRKLKKVWTCLLFNISFRIELFQVNILLTKYFNNSECVKENKQNN